MCIEGGRGEGEGECDAVRMEDIPRRSKDLNLQEKDSTSVSTLPFGIERMFATYLPPGEEERREEKNRDQPIFSHSTTPQH